MTTVRVHVDHAAGRVVLAVATPVDTGTLSVRWRPPRGLDHDGAHAVHAAVSGALAELLEIAARPPPRPPHDPTTPTTERTPPMDDPSLIDDDTYPSAVDDWRNLPPARRAWMRHLEGGGIVAVVPGSIHALNRGEDPEPENRNDEDDLAAALAFPVGDAVATPGGFTCADLDAGLALFAEDGAA